MHSQTRSFGRFLYNHNPFYLLSACLVLYGLQSAFQDGGALPSNAWLLASTLCGYTLLLAGTAYAVVRFGRVWEDARSLALLIVFMFVAISVSFDQICNTFPSTAAMVLTAALAFTLVVSEGLIRALKIKLPPAYRFPLYLMFTLFFLYPLLVSPNLTELSESLVAWRVFLFPTIAGVVLLTLIPAIRLGSQRMQKNGTPWDWPWFPWPIFVFLALGVCGRSYVLTFSFQAAMDWETTTPASAWQTSFGLYYLTPFFLAVLVLLAEIAIAEQLRGLIRFVMAITPMLILFSIPIGSSKAFVEFLDLFLIRIGSPIWMAVIGTTVFYAYLRERGIKSAEVGMLSSLAAATFVGPTTLGINSLTEPQWWPLALIGCVQLHKAITLRSSLRCSVAMCSFIAALACGFHRSWLMDYYGVIPLHLAMISSFVIAATFQDRFAVLLRQVNPLVTIVAAAGLACGGQSVGLPTAFTLAYAIALTLLAAGYWQVTKRELWKAAMLANIASVVVSAIMWMHTGLAVVVPPRAVTALSWGAISFCIAALISAVKGGIGRKLRRSIAATIASIRRELHEEAT